MHTQSPPTTWGGGGRRRETHSALLSAAVPRRADYHAYTADRHEPLPLLPLPLLHGLVGRSGGGLERRLSAALDQPRVALTVRCLAPPLHIRLHCVSLPRLLGMVDGRGEGDEGDA
jgi:hypothetical protein